MAQNRNSGSSSRDRVAKFAVTSPGTLLEVAQLNLPDHKPAKLKSMLRHGQFAVNGTPTTQFDYQLSSGDIFWVKFNGSFNVFSHSKVKIVYEDNDIIVVDKSSGFLSTEATISSPKEKDKNVLAVVLKHLRKGNSQAKLYPVHRLDRDTSGIMILARNSKARERLVKQWKELVTDRRFTVIVGGVITDNKGEVKSCLAENPETHLMMSVDNPRLGRNAVTRFEVVKRGKHRTMIQTTQKNMMKGQIRVHMSDIGHPVCGDIAYGGTYTPLRRLAIHSSLLSIVHPISGKSLTFSSPLPEGFEELVKWQGE